MHQLLAVHFAHHHHIGDDAQMDFPNVLLSQLNRHHQRVGGKHRVAQALEDCLAKIIQDRGIVFHQQDIFAGEGLRVIGAIGCIQGDIFRFDGDLAGVDNGVAGVDRKIGQDLIERERLGKPLLEKHLFPPVPARKQERLCHLFCLQ